MRIRNNNSVLIAFIPKVSDALFTKSYKQVCDNLMCYVNLKWAKGTTMVDLQIGSWPQTPQLFVRMWRWIRSLNLSLAGGSVCVLALPSGENTTYKWVRLITHVTCSISIRRTNPLRTPRRSPFFSRNSHRQRTCNWPKSHLSEKFCSHYLWCSTPGCLHRIDLFSSVVSAAAAVSLQCRTSDVQASKQSGGCSPTLSVLATLAATAARAFLEV